MLLHLFRQLPLGVPLTGAKGQNLCLHQPTGTTWAGNIGWLGGGMFALGNHFLLCFHDRAGPWLSRYCLTFQFIHQVNGYEVWAISSKENGFGGRSGVRRGKKKKTSLILLKNPQVSFSFFFLLLKKDPYNFFFLFFPTRYLKTPAKV